MQRFFKNPTVRKWIIRPLLIFAIAMTALTAIVFTIVATQQQRIVNIAITELNRQFKGELTIAESQISMFKNFPYISVALHDGKFFGDKTQTGKPIYQFDRLYVGFSVIEVIQQHYNVKMLYLHGGTLDLVQDENGKINLLEAEAIQSSTQNASQENTANAADASFAIDLKKIIMQDVNVTFIDQASSTHVNARIDKLNAALNMDSSRLKLLLSGGLKLDVTNDSDTTFFRNKKVQLDIAADYQLHKRVFEVSACNLKLQEAGFNITGFADLSDTTNINFRIKGEKQDFSLFTAFLPEHVQRDLKPFAYDGRLQFDALVHGKISDGKLPHIQVTFGCEDAWFLNTGANKKVDQLGFKGFYTNGPDRSLETSELHIMNVNARPEKGIFKGHFVVRDFTNPQAVIKINSELELKFLGEFFGIPDLKQITGKIKLDMNLKELHDIQLPEESLSKLKEGIQSKLSVEDLSFRIPGYPHAVRNMNIRAEMKDGRVTVDSATLTIADSDLEFNGSISDVRAFLRERDKTIKLALNVGSHQVMLSNLLSYDTALARKWNEEIHRFNVHLALETTVRQLLNPSPLPKGKFEVKHLRGTFKNYPHTFKDLSATITINDTLLRLRDFTGMIDSSDINFKGRVINYHLWFDEVKKGKTQIAFDFKSNRFAFKDVLGREIRQYLPRGYRREELNNVWLRAKIDLKYDTVFRFAKAHISNITADLKKHKLKLKEISGGVKYGSKILAFDTLRGMIGNSDFDISLKYYFKGIDRNNNKVANTLKFKSKLLDVDEMSLYDLAPKTGRSRRDTTAAQIARAKADSSQHAQAFNIFMIPFSDFNAQIDITKIKYRKLWMKEVSARLTMKPDQTITVDTLTLKMAGGAIRMRGKFNGSDHTKIYFRSRINFEQIDIEKMLLKLDHFGQDIVINKHIKGHMSGVLKSYVQVHPNLVPIVNNSRASLTVKIYNGTLIDFAPMQAMASYFKDKNLRLIRFDTLENKLSFKDGILEIPAMDINSSLGYIRMSGKQSLDLNMEYYVRVPMKMVTKVGFNSLFQRKREDVDLQQVDEIEFLDKDKKIAFMNLKVTGTPDNFKVGLGKDKRVKS